jgi:hypothetical protein
MTVATDWVQMLASAAAGAAAGGLVSWIAAPHTANRQERGRNRSEARESIRTIIGPILTNVRAYQDHAYGSMGRDPDENTINADDVALCAKILSTSATLSWWRRRLVVRCVAQLFGSITVELCGIHGESAGDPSAVMGILLNRRVNALKNPQRFKHPDKGEFDQALRCSPDSKEVADLVRALSRLKESR